MLQQQKAQLKSNLLTANTKQNIKQFRLCVSNTQSYPTVQIVFDVFGTPIASTKLISGLRIDFIDQICNASDCFIEILFGSQRRSLLGGCFHSERV